jgi:hypothetical protein
MIRKAVKIHFESLVAAKCNALGITLYPHIHFRLFRDQVRQELMKHELIHVEQVERSSVIKFYSLYGLEYLIRYFLGREDEASAYYMLQDEVEARRRQWEPFTVRDLQILEDNDLLPYEGKFITKEEWEAL